jgi:hypothetical protein
MEISQSGGCGDYGMEQFNLGYILGDSIEMGRFYGLQF